MEKTFPLNQTETGQLAQLDQERTQALAMVGALSLDMEQARKNLDGVAERQRAFVGQALSSRGIAQYQNARAANGTLVVTLPDQPVPMPQAEPALPPKIEKVNGPRTTNAKE